MPWRSAALQRGGCGYCVAGDDVHGGVPPHPCLFHYAMPGTSADNDAWIQRKNNVVNRYGHSSFFIGTDFRARAKNFDIDARLDPNLYAAHGGAFPIIIREVGVIGTITVSGLPQAEDHEFVVGQIRAFLGSHE